MPLTKLIKNLEILEQEVKKTFDAFLPNYLGEVTEVQKEQLNEGLNSEGGLLMKTNSNYYPYSPSYTAYKRAKGLQTNVVDLKLTGAFQRGIRTYKTGTMKANITSVDSKTTKLKTEFNNIFGIAPQMTDKLGAKFIKPISNIVKSKLKAA
jgi:hypothetical protein